MCIMEIHPGAHLATMLQALAHNASTWDRDADMLLPIMDARGDHEVTAGVQRAHDHVKAAYAIMLELFGEEVARMASDPDGHVHLGDVGSERTLVSVLDSATRAAKKDETR